MPAEINKIIKKTIELFISQIDLLLMKTYGEGRVGKEELYNKVANFLLTSFPDGGERFTKLRYSLPITNSKFVHNETEEYKQALSLIHI